MKYISHIVISAVILFQSALSGYSHKINNASGMPVRVALFTPTGLLTTFDLASGKEVTLPGNFLQRIAAVEVEYHGMDPRLSGLRARWTPVGTPPPATRIAIEAPQWGQDPDTMEIVDDGWGGYNAPGVVRHTALKLAVSEFQ